MQKRSEVPEGPLLEIEAIDARYGKNRVLKEISLSVVPGEVVALIGPNAAGKSTTMRVIAGLKAPKSGTVRFDGEDITRKGTPDRVRLGLALVPEGRQVFTDFSVRENLMMGAYSRADRNELEKDFERVFAIFPKLAERQKQRAGSMSGGEQQMVAIGRGLMARPRCLMLDEPTLGLAPIVIEEIEEALRKLSGEGLTILVSEQNAVMALNVADRAYVLDSGAISYTGLTSTLQNPDAIKELYLGV